MGTVYEAFQESMRRKVALKILDAGLFPSNKQVHRFEREAWIAGRLNHPNIVKVFGQGTEGNTHYIAMELLSGRSLQDAIRDAKKSRDEASSSDSAWRTGHVRRTVELFVGLADALGHVHQQGIVHRDIKPGNLLLEDDDSRLLLTDFGLARDVDASRVTRRGDFFGTVRYGDFTEPIEDLGDGEPPGTLVLEPSRELALATRRFVRYVGDTVELPVTVHVETRTAVRVQLEDCPN